MIIHMMNLKILFYNRINKIINPLKFCFNMKIKIYNNNLNNLVKEKKLKFKKKVRIKNLLKYWKMIYKNNMFKINK